ncbi:hypothetical protein E4U43_000715 [Claviceps pusilla]|uniref:Uncharacterized protein n=1 Tax=Claviceps pusilla TaxID=123648 RepID=A0A9P7NBF7_9HYPO|nr:hypothetical protein E4U43_000715 [Claviceps pusilla]
MQYVFIPSPSSRLYCAFGPWSHSQDAKSRDRPGERRRQKEQNPHVSPIQDEVFENDFASHQQERNEHYLMDELLSSAAQYLSSSPRQTDTTSEVLSPFDDGIYPIWPLGFNLSGPSDSFQKTTADPLTQQNVHLGTTRLETCVYELSQDLPLIHANEESKTPEWSGRDYDAANKMLPKQNDDSTQIAGLNTRKCLAASDISPDPSARNTKPEDTVAEVEYLYEIGVKVGFLTKNEAFVEFLREMHRKYKKISRLNEMDNVDSASGSSSVRDD